MFPIRANRFVRMIFLCLLLVSLFFGAMLVHAERSSVSQATYLYLPLVVRSKLPGANWAAYEIRVVELANQERAKYGCSALVMNDTLHQVAYNHSADMIARDFFDHTNPDGKDPGERLTDIGYSWSTCGENIAAG